MPNEAKFADFNKPICETSEEIVDFLKKNRQEVPLFGEVLATLCESAFYTYKAITRLLAKENEIKYVPQAWTLVRSIIDIYFSVVYLIDNPLKNTKRFNSVTLRVMNDEYKKYVRLYQQDPTNNKNPEDFKRMMLSNGQFFGLTIDEINHIEEWEKPNKYWAIPSHIIGGFPEGEMRSFLEWIWHTQYSRCSDIAHYTGAGLGQHIYSRTPDSMKTRPGSFESDAVVMAIEFLALIFSEIQAVIDCGMKQKLKGIWDLLIGHNREYAADLYERYREYFEQG